MSEWWTYRPSDFLMFSPRAYERLHEMANLAHWPLQVLILGATLASLQALLRVPRKTCESRSGMPVRAVLCLAAACWAWVGWDFLQIRYAPINWAASWMAAAFAVQAVLLAAMVAFGKAWSVPIGRRRTASLFLIGWALVGHPLLCVALGRRWIGAEVIGTAPDPTVIATLGLLAGIAGNTRIAHALWCAAWALPLAACLLSAATLWTMDSWLALSLAGAAAAVVVALAAPGAERPRPMSQ